MLPARFDARILASQLAFEPRNSVSIRTAQATCDERGCVKLRTPNPGKSPDSVLGGRLWGDSVRSDVGIKPQKSL